MITLRPAVLGDARMFRKWGREPHVVACHTDDSDAYDPDEDWGWDGEIPRAFEWRELLIIERDG